MDISNSTQYKKHTHREHILELPDTYIGSTETVDEYRWIFDENINKMVWKQIKFNPGFYKIFDEVIVNARDEYIRSQDTEFPVKHIRVNVSNNSHEGCTINVENDGKGIPIEKHPIEKIYIPELIFGNLLTSSNYNKEEEKIVGGKNGYGSKCFRLNTRILLWSGEIKLADQINKDDILIGDDGETRKVLDISRGRGPMYEVQQAHGETYYVNNEHILTLHMPDHKVIFWNNTLNGWSVLWWDNNKQQICRKSINCSPPPKIICPVCHNKLHSNLARHYKRIHPELEVPTQARKSPTKNLQESMESLIAHKELEEFCKTIPDNNVFDISIQDYLSLNETTKKRLAGVRNQNVNWTYQPVVLDPYVLGLWLGDGYQTGYSYACYEEKDPEIIEYLTKWCNNNDANLTKINNYQYNFSSKSHRGKKGYAPLKKQLEKYNLIKNKHIPKEYLINSREVRLAVLAGIIDTDGHVSRNGTRISIAQGLNHTQLANDIVYLARSLGFACHMNIRNTAWMLNGEKRIGKAHAINISGNGLEDIPTRLPRKKCASTINKNTSKSTGFLTIRDIGIDDFIGITIDGNERFLINDFTVTHNCTNIFSSNFKVEIKSSDKHYTQTWRNNMSECNEPEIHKSTSKHGLVKISFQPDSSRFKGIFEGNCLCEDMISVLRTRVIELASMTENVSWNGKQISSNSFEKYMKLFTREGVSGIAYESCGPRWEIGAILTSHMYSSNSDNNTDVPDERHISFVNGIMTKKGGKHCEYISKHILTEFCETCEKKKINIKPAQIKDSIIFFINSTIVNPSFDSQTKDYLTTPPSKFGSQPQYKGKLIQDLVKLGLLEEARMIMEAKTLRDAKKTDGKKKSVLRGIPKLEDALWAGTAKSKDCTLILTEGDSAATSAISGLTIVGREAWGVFPLRGKLLNVKDISIQKFNSNEELISIKRIIGLEHGKVYTSINELRYGRIMIMADQDHDGSHIKGLIMNLFHTEWKSLLEFGFVFTLKTPLLKSFRGNDVKSFYSEQEFQEWKTTNETKGWKIKYYKGLGTSTPAEAREWFKDMNDLNYTWDRDSDNAFHLAFNKKRADDRKKWLENYDPTRRLSESERKDGVVAKASLTRFVHDELIHFSNADNIRSLPHIMDGLKPSQRKILYGCFKRNLYSEIKVAQLSGFVSENAAYHHGEASLNSTIIGMAQNFIGSNNLNLLKPIGQMGSRLMGGEDAASPRYVHTCLESIIPYLFRKEDECLLTYKEEEGESIEPTFYIPVVPLVAINGCIGIGTGFSTHILPYNPSEIISLVKHRLEGTLETTKGHILDPYWIGFKGGISRQDAVTWITKGNYVMDRKKHTVTITELPVGFWTKNYKMFLDELISNTSEPFGLKHFEDLYTDTEIKFVLYFTENGFNNICDSPSSEFEKNFRLTTSWKTTNMHGFNHQMNIVKYNTIGDIIEEFVQCRLPYYEQRKQYILKNLQSEIELLDSKLTFLKAVIDNKIILFHKSDSEIIEMMKMNQIKPLSKPNNPDIIDSFDYVLSMRIDRLKESSIQDMQEKRDEKNKYFTYIQSQSPQTLWISDLHEFQTAYEQYYQSRIFSEVSETKPKKKVNIKKSK